MDSLFIVIIEPEIKILLQLTDGVVELLAERDAVELIEHGFMEPLDDAVGLRAFGLGAGMVDVLDGQVGLVFVTVVGTAELGAAVGQQALQRDAVRLEEGNDAIVEQIGGGDRCLAVVELGEAEL